MEALFINYRSCAWTCNYSQSKLVGCFFIYRPLIWEYLSTSRVYDSWGVTAIWAYSSGQSARLLWYQTSNLFWKVLWKTKSWCFFHSLTTIGLRSGTFSEDGYCSLLDYQSVWKIISPADTFLTRKLLSGQPIDLGFP